MVNSRSFKVNIQFVGRFMALFVIILLVLGSFTGTALATPSAGPRLQGEGATPYQSALANALSQRGAAGLPVPASVTYSYQASGDQSLAAQAGGPHTVTITATTVVNFDGPQQAGYDQWPALIVKDNLPAGAQGSVAAGDYTETYRAAMEAKFPGIWQQYQFGQEPRKETITETYVINYPAGAALAGSSPSAAAASAEQILMGFIYSGPHFDYAIEDSAEVCVPVLGCATIYSFKAGFELDWALGLRLPAEASLSGPDQMVQGNSYNFSSTLNPLDWSASQYTNAGVAAEGGNEFVLRLNFFVGVQGEVLGFDLCPSCHVTVNEDQSTSFTTPFGPGATFPIPAANIPIYTFDLTAFFFSVGLGIQPHLGSSIITADWNAVPGTDCTGSGQVTYTQPGVPATVGPVKACNLGPTDQAQVELSNFRYWFNEFLIELTADLNFKLFGYGVWNPTVTITDFDLSPLTGGLFVGDHTECDTTFNCGRSGPDNTLVVSSSVVDETPPTTGIALAGTAGNHGWYRSDVQVTLDPEDGPQDCGVGVDTTEYGFDGINWIPYAGPFMLTDEGETTVYYRSTDLEGNIEPVKSQLVKIDKTMPVITGAPTTPPNAFGWWNTDVVVHFEATDAVSGIDTVTPDVTVSTEGLGQFVIGTAVDMAGNSASATVGDLNIDKTAPALTINSPDPIAYANTDTPIADWTASDALSGIATETGDLDGVPVNNGDVLDLLLVAAGDHTFTVEVVDKADNVTTQFVTFFVSTDINGMIAGLEHMCDLGLIGKAGLCNSLLAKLNNARRAMERGQCKTAENILNAFMHELDAQNGKGLSPQVYDVLKTNAEFVIANLPADCQDAPANQPGGNNNPAPNGNDNIGNPPESQNPGNGNGNGNGNSQGNGNGNGQGNTQGNGNGNGNGNSQGNGNGNGQGNGNGSPPSNPGKGKGG